MAVSKSKPFPSRRTIPITPEGKAYSPVTVNVPNSYAAGDEGKVVSGGALVAQTSKNISSSGTTDTTLNNSVVVPAGSATTPATTITPNTISISVNSSTGVISASNTAKTQSVTPTVSEGYVSSGTAGTITVAAASATSNLTTQAAQTITPTTTDQTIASGKYLTGAQTIKGDVNLVAGNIKNGVSIFGVSGSYQGGGGWELIDSRDVDISTTSTSEIIAATYTISHTFSTTDDIYVLVVMDKAGQRSGYLTAEYSFSFPEPNTSGSFQDKRKFYLGWIVKRESATYYSSAGYYGKNNGSWVGIYCQGLEQSDGTTTVNIGAKYSSSNTKTINGTYNIRLYRLPFPQNGNPFNYSFT